MPTISLCAFLLLGPLATGVVKADAPSITGLFPAGVQRGTTRILKLRGNIKTRPISVWCDRPVVNLTLADDKDELSVTVPAEVEPGRCWVRLSNAEGAGDLYPLLVGLLPEVSETEPNNRVSEATAIATLPTIVDGKVHKSEEVDIFAVQLESGQQLVAAVESREPLGTPADMVLQVLSPQGYVLSQNDDYAGFDPLIAFTAQESGPVYVRVFAFPATPDSSIRFAGGEDYVYRLTLTTGPFVSHVLKSAGHQDAETAAISVGWNLSDNASSVDSIPGLFWNRPERRIEGRLEPQSAPPAALADSESPDWSQPIIGRISQPGEVDNFKYTAKKGESVFFRVAAQGVGSLLDPVLQVHDAEGKLFKESDDISRDDRDISVDWKPSSDVDCWVSLRDRFGHGSGQHVYHLTATSLTPGVKLTVEADHFTLGRDKQLEIPVKVDRIAGYDQALTIKLDGLPPGVTHDAVVSEPKGDSAKEVKLKLEVGESGGFNGPMRIVAHRGDESEPSALATASTRLPGVRSELLWLTIAAPPAP